jgi:zinc D-Ala-D-Ala carboxypeptidase
MNLSPNFTLQELTHSDAAVRHGWENNPDANEINNLTRLADLLEKVRAVVNKPIMINSGYRCKLVNDSVGSSDKSQHRIGCAADIRVPGMTPDEVVKAVIASGMEYDQLIREFDSWTHISVVSTAGDHPRRQSLIIDKSGTRPYA